MSDSTFGRALFEISILGFRFHPMKKEDVIEAIRKHVHSQTRMIMGNLNLHGMALMYRSLGMRRLLSAPETLVMIDGMPIVWIGKLLGFRINRSHRMTSLDYFDDMFRLGASEGWRFDYIGSTPEVVQKGLDTLRRRIPGLDIEGCDGYFDMDDSSSGSKQELIIAKLEKRNADVVIVGMGMPRQEEWINAVVGRLSCRVFIPVGAYLEYQVGSLALPPRWLGQIGFEWLFRLVTAPRRLTYRYLVEPFHLILLLIFKEHPQKDFWKRKFGH